MFRLIIFLGFALLVNPMRAQAEPTAFRAGQFSLGLAGGGGTGGFGIGLDVGYLVADGLEVSLGASYWSLEDTSLVRITPGARYIFVQLGTLMPYVGGFARRWIFTDDVYQDQTSIGGRAGAHFRAGPSALFGLGVAYERILDCPDSLSDECTSIYPEFGLSILF